MEITRLTHIVIPLREVRGYITQVLPVYLDNRKIQGVIFDIASNSLVGENTVHFHSTGNYYDILTDSGMDDDAILAFMDDMYGVFYGLTEPYLGHLDFLDNPKIEYCFDLHGPDMLLFSAMPVNSPGVLFEFDECYR